MKLNSTSMRPSHVQAPLPCFGFSQFLFSWDDEAHKILCWTQNVLRFVHNRKRNKIKMRCTENLKNKRKLRSPAVFKTRCLLVLYVVQHFCFARLRPLTICNQTNSNSFNNLDGLQHQQRQRRRKVMQVCCWNAFAAWVSNFGLFLHNKHLRIYWRFGCC